MISTTLARALRDSGLVWRPEPGDAFRIDRLEVESDIFILSDMTVEAHEFSTGTVIGFNGTTEWALDSVDLGDTLWMPHEHQLRALLRASFRSLTVLGAEEAGGPDVAAPPYRVTAVIGGEAREFDAAEPDDAYGRALLALIDESIGDPLPELDDELA